MTLRYVRDKGWNKTLQYASWINAVLTVSHSVVVERYQNVTIFIAPPPLFFLDLLSSGALIYVSRVYGNIGIIRRKRMFIIAQS